MPRLRYKLTRLLPDILKTLAAAAKGGDIQAARLILERTLPALKSAAETLTLPAPETLAGQGRVVLEAVASGEISPDEALKLMQAVGRATADSGSRGDGETHRGAGASLEPQAEMNP